MLAITENTQIIAVMGKVFSPEEIEQGHIPEEGAHEAAGRAILNRLFIGDEAFVWNTLSAKLAGGMVYGSTALGKANKRSDVDVLVVYRGDRSDILDDVRGVFTEAEDRFHVPIEAHMLEFNSSGRPSEHTLDPLLLNHLFEIQEQDDPRWSYNWPLSYLSIFLPEEDPSEAQLRHLAQRYSTAKMRQFAHALTDYRGEVNYKTLQRALELPTALGRKVIAATIDPEMGQAPHPLPPADSNDIMLTKLANLPQPKQGDEAARTMRQLAMFNREYSSLLELTIDGNVTTGVYSDWLERNYLYICQQAHDLAYHWKEIIAEDYDRPVYTATNLIEPSPDDPGDVPYYEFYP